MPNTERLSYTVDEVAAGHKCNPATIWRAINAERIRSIKIGKLRRIPRDEAERIAREGW